MRGASSFGLLVSIRAPERTLGRPNVSAADTALSVVSIRAPERTLGRPNFKAFTELLSGFQSAPQSELWGDINARSLAKSASVVSIRAPERTLGRPYGLTPSDSVLICFNPRPRANSGATNPRSLSYSTRLQFQSAPQSELWGDIVRNIDAVSVNLFQSAPQSELWGDPPVIRLHA